MLKKSCSMFSISDLAGTSLEEIDRIYQELSASCGVDHDLPFRSRREFEIDEAYQLLRSLYVQQETW